MNNSHIFSDSLKKSHEAEDLPFWRECYENAFPDMVSMVNHRQDGIHQRAGIDRSVILSNSKQITIDEKVRGKNKKTGKVYDDILLEYWSNENAREPGWVCKPLLCDYIAYAIAPLGVCYLLPVLQLQLMWSKYKDVFIKEGKEVRARNQTTGNAFYTTVSVAIPAHWVMYGVQESLVSHFSAFEL